MPKTKTPPPEPHLLPEGTYPKVPELDWLKDLAVQAGEEGSADADKLWYAYKYLYWSMRYARTPATRPEHTVCVGFITKFHRLLYGIPITAAEQSQIDRAEAAYKGRKRG